MPLMTMGLKETESKPLVQKTRLEHYSDLQKERCIYKPLLPASMKGPVEIEEVNLKVHQDEADTKTLKTLFPLTYDQKFVFLKASDKKDECSTPLNLGVVLSGGQAAGGHTVISGIYDYIKTRNPQSQLYGFIKGPRGIFTHDYIKITDELMMDYRNQGGFDMICSGRDKISTQDQMEKSKEICERLELHGLVVIGGDDSNTNAAVLAEHFKKTNCQTCVVGVPKTIDGDLRNEFIEASFGFDTAVKVYSEYIGNLAKDVATYQNQYHFVRLMGRSASHIALECALQCRPNYCVIGEEVREKAMTLTSIVKEICDVIVKRYEQKKCYGLILIPEGLIEFIPEIGTLISEINDIVAHKEFDRSALTESARNTFDSLPESVQKELLFERDPHGNVQVSKIATEKLLLTMAQKCLESQHPSCAAKFQASCHFFGYEGRCALPSNFDTNYCYALGQIAATLVQYKKTGYVAFIRHLCKSTNEWLPAGCPLTKIMTIEKRHGKETPVIKKYLVDTKATCFKIFKKYLESWKLNDQYRCPGPIQFHGNTSLVSNYTIQLPTDADFAFDKTEKPFNFKRSSQALSPLEKERAAADIDIAPILKSGKHNLTPLLKCMEKHSPDQIEHMIKNFSLQLSETQSQPLKCDEPLKHHHGQSDITLKVGVVFIGQQAPGSQNVLCGLVQRLKNCGKVYGFKGYQGLLKEEYTEINCTHLTEYINQGGCELLGVYDECEEKLTHSKDLEKVVSTCKKMKLHGIVLVGAEKCVTYATYLTEKILDYEQRADEDAPSTCVLCVPTSCENELNHHLLETSVGFDSVCKSYSALIGNLSTDSASAIKYWYFIRLGNSSNALVECALQNHPNTVVLPEMCSATTTSFHVLTKAIADAICERAEMKKDFGTILIPESLINHLPETKQLLGQMTLLLDSVTTKEDMHKLHKEFVDLDPSAPAHYCKMLSPCSFEFFKILPKPFREQLIFKPKAGLSKVSHLGLEELVASFVEKELQKRKTSGTYKGSFAPICHYLGYQCRSTFPSEFDCNLGLAHGYVASILLESGKTGYCTSIRGLCDPASSWRMCAIPLTCMYKIPVGSTTVSECQTEVYDAFDSIMGKSLKKDQYCNPGSIQYSGECSKCICKSLSLKHYDSLKMSQHIQSLTTYLRLMCDSGVTPTTLLSTVISLEAVTDTVANDGNICDRKCYTNNLKKTKCFSG